MPFRSCPAAAAASAATHRCDRVTSLSGVSNFCVTALDCILETARIKPHINQLNYHIGIDDEVEGLIKYMQEQRIQLVAWGPTAGTERGHVGLETKYQKHKIDYKNVDWVWETPEMHALGAVQDAARDVGAKYGKSRFDVFLRWLVQKGYALVTSSKKTAHMIADVDAVSSHQWQLNETDIASLSSLRLPAGAHFANIHPYGGRSCTANTPTTTELE